MANVRESPRKSEDKGKEDNYTLYFTKDCNCGVIINEHLLPNFIRESTLTSLFVKCIDCLIFANIRLDARRFVNLLIRAVGEYSDIVIENRNHLRQLLDKICDACKACRNFVHETEIKECPLCDGEEGVKSTPKEVRYYLLHFLLYLNFAIFYFSLRLRIRIIRKKSISI